MRETVIIADSSPLIFLARIELLDLLPKLGKEIIIPPEVWKEITEYGRDLPGATEVSQVSWLKIQSPDPLRVQPLNILVDMGEAEAIALAQSIPKCLLLIDDSRARKVAEHLKIRRLGTVGLLLRAKNKKLIKTIQPYILALEECGIYIRKELIEAILKEAGEL